MTRGIFMRTTALLLISALLAMPAYAQEGDEASEIDSVEVTGSRISYSDLADTPAISITKQGDYLLQKITLINDTRSEEGRKQEIYSTIEKIIAKAGGQYQVLSVGSFRSVLNKNNLKVDLVADKARPDVSRVTLNIRAPITGKPDDGDKLVADLREFARSIQKVGRTEVDVSDETALGMNKPERYRYEVISAIATDSKKVASELGKSCQLNLDKLNNRIEWERASATELLLYIRYTIEVTGCSAITN